jgi:membrane-associated phospholipid phosphatase
VIHQRSSHDKKRIKSFLVIAYIALAMIFVLMTGFGLRLSFLIPLLLPIAFIDGRPKQFLVQWAPFYIIILLYDSFRGFADDLASRVEYLRLIQWEKAIFAGHIPTQYLQYNHILLLNGWLGRVLAIFYFGHFILPVGLHYWTWKRNRQAFICCVSCLCFLSISGFITFFLFPAAPPWLASQKGFISPVSQIIMNHIEAVSLYMHRIYIGMNANPVAAFPSLHAAYPMLWFLCGIRFFSRKVGMLLLVNAVVVAFTIVAFGEHYVVDVIAGWIYAACSYFFVAKVLLPMLNKRLLPADEESKTTPSSANQCPQPVN